MNCEFYCGQEDDCTFIPTGTSSSLQSTTDTLAPKKPRLCQKSYRKKVETVWSHENILKLINAVETRRCLWDAGSVDYKLPKEGIWQEVADSIPVSFNDCKGKWANLRTTFNSNVDKLRKKKSGQGTDEEPKIFWKYFKAMMFLETAKISQSTQSASSMQLESATTDESVFSLVGFGEEMSLLSPSPAGKRRSRKDITPSPMTSGRNIELKEMAVEALQSIRSRDSKPNDTFTAFGEYIAAELRALSSEQATFARSKMRHAFNNIMDEITLKVPQGQETLTNETEKE